MLGLATGTAVVDDQLFRDGCCEFGTVIAFYQAERKVDAGAHAGGGPDWAIVDEDAVGIDSCGGELLLQFTGEQPVRRHVPAVYQARFAEQEGAGADGRGAAGEPGSGAQAIKNLRVGRRWRDQPIRVSSRRRASGWVSTDAPKEFTTSPPSAE